MVAIQVSGLTKTHGGLRAVDGVDLEAAEGELVAARVFRWETV